MLNENFMSAPVQPKACKTCPFEGKEAVDLTSEKYAYYIDNLKTGGHHLCHSVNNEMICRGGRTIQLRLFTAFGWISEPTDEALHEAYQEYLQNRELFIAKRRPRRRKRFPKLGSLTKRQR